MTRTVSSLVSLLLIAGMAAAQTRASRIPSADSREINAYQLTMPVVEKYVHAALAIRNDAAVKKCFEGAAASDHSLDSEEKLLKSCPAAVTDLNAAGISAREFLILTGALVGDLMMAGMKRQGTMKQYPPTMTPENAAFVDENYQKLRDLLAPLNQQVKIVGQAKQQ